MASIEILGRIKPNLKNNKDLCVQHINNNIIVKRKQKSIISDYSLNHNYNLDKLFDQSSVNLDIYNYLSINILRSLFKEKKNVTFFLYGQTGSGKTHTLLGSKNEEGFLEMLLNDVLEINYQIKISVIEIYNNKCMDILNNRKVVTQRVHNHEFVISYINELTISKKNQINLIKKRIAKFLVIGTSSENDISSRSHLKITLTINNCILNLHRSPGITSWGQHDQVRRDIVSCICSNISVTYLTSQRNLKMASPAGLHMQCYL